MDIRETYSYFLKSNIDEELSEESNIDESISNSSYLMDIDDYEDIFSIFYIKEDNEEYSDDYYDDEDDPILFYDNEVKCNTEYKYTQFFISKETL